MKILGKNPDEAQQQQFAGLPNYENGAFQNLGGVTFSPADAPLGKMLADFIRKPKSVKPSRPVPVVQTDLRHAAFATPTVTWFGHSSYLIQSQGVSVLVDPVFSGNASPVPGSVRAFSGTNHYQVADLPPIDLLVLTHDHYDHLDYATIDQLRGRVQRVIAPLGVGGHLRHWGWEAARIIELNWGEQATVAAGLAITAVPAQHMSGRGLRPRRTLWAAFVLELHGCKIFVGGDSGYGPHFKAIGAGHGPFDLAILENGQYNLHWHAIHTLPTETAQAAVDLRARMLLPVHWAKFVLAYHPWNEPIKGLLLAADALGLPVTVPQIGEPYPVGAPARRTPWWDFE